MTQDEQQFFSELNKYPMFTEQQLKDTSGASNAQQQPNILSMLSAFGSMGRPSSAASNSSSNSNQSQQQQQNDITELDQEFWNKLRQFLNQQLPGDNRAQKVYDNFRAGHLQYIKSEGLAEPTGIRSVPTPAATDTATQVGLELD
ncbi:hypothetical protein SAMD00019534_032280 [Acytostelium subglobosum LB1]|uniref:hypothetical protein n=1 Tax=Acytostelium subglobosum LB1 TaxID=1410327 RepID=UPI0006449911|nr:hypothetical protein SAMD00019534_032280 [Acytostelium subglobosum LB1]GAM20053.1 hypothetical protein SAMD00019534_032280 [Acytostelium subglobosum LB1]|eukprot:XP_012756815.1 hypothetical protein SAMD00019534_032280 [Acytostelium subglobosum LB1]